ncbi:MAG: CAP domain-containing protein [Verrucomicrobiota bacterium]
MRDQRLLRWVVFLMPAVMPSVTSLAQPATGYLARPTINLGEAAPAPTNLVLNPPPARGVKPALQPTGGFAVDTDSREQVREFYNALYPISENVAQYSTADVSSCTPGHNTNSFQQAELLRINWYRAMAGMPAAIYLDPIDNWGSQQMAVIMSANNALNHDPPSTYTCYNTFAAGYAGGDQSLGADGADAITDFIWDFGAKNNEVGHRRWILYPEEIVMGVGDVPAAGTNAAANLTYVFDPLSFGARPATRQPYVAWPPEGYVPYQVVFPYWSFALTNADFTNATVTMASNGVPVSVAIQTNQVGFGENTIVWVPMGLDATTEGTSFPFSDTDTVYNVTVGNINYNGAIIQYSYNVTVFDPAMPGADYVATAVSGPAQATVNGANPYSVTPSQNPYATSYNLLMAQLVSGNLADSANHGLTNFTTSPPPLYPIITNPPVGSGNCFHLCHTNPTSQYLQLNELLFPSNTTMFSFASLLGYATTNEVAYVQASTNNGGTWQNLFTEVGSGGSGESSFTSHSLSLSNYAGLPTMVRFDYSFTGGSYYPEADPFVGWCLENTVVTNTLQMINLATNTSSVTNIVSGNLADSANNGLVNFTVSPPPYYYVITNPPAGAEPACFHLCHLDPASQLMQLNEVLAPTAGTTVSFNSLLAYASPDETALVEVSTNNGATWDDLFAETGLPDNQQPVQSSFSPQSVSLSPFAGQLTWLRFNYSFTGGEYWPYSDPDTGWDLEDILVTNTLQQVITTVNTTNFTFTPMQTGNYVLQAQPVVFGQYPLDPGPIKQITAVVGPPVLMMSRPVLTNQQVWLNFTESGGPATSFHLLQTPQLTASWTTNSAATFTTNVPGSSYRFTVTTNSAKEFYRVQTP